MHWSRLALRAQANRTAECLHSGAAWTWVVRDFCECTPQRAAHRPAAFLPAGGFWWKLAQNRFCDGGFADGRYPPGKGFGAELRGVTLADVAADDAAYKEVRAAFEEHSVLLFRGQDVSDETQIAYSRRFGPLEATKVGSEGKGTNLVILKTLDDTGNVVPEDHRLALRNKANQLWHTDSPFKRLPALASVLSSRIIPGRGGETEFVSTRLAFERLDPALRTRLEKSFAWHDYAYSRGKIAPGLASPEERAALPPQCWRLVWKIRLTAAARFTSPRMPMRSKAWKTRRAKSFLQS